MLPRISEPELRFGAVLLGLLALMWLGGRIVRRDGQSIASGRATALAIVYATLYVAFILPPIATTILFTVLGILAVNEVATAFTRASPISRFTAPRIALTAVAATAPWFPALAHATGWPITGWLAAAVAVLTLAPRFGALPSAQTGAVLAGTFAIIALDLFCVLRVLPLGGRLCLFVFFLLNVADTAAFFCGKLWGKRRLAPKISPKKTVEGSLGSLLITIGCAFLFNRILELGFSASQTTVAAILLNVLGQVGDLLASLLKRRLGVKDFGTLLGGHGGVLDRFDSCLLAVPGFLLWLRLVR